MLRFTTAGESHGKAVVAILEGIPAGWDFERRALPHVNAELKRRQGGYGRGGRMAIESDQVEVLGGLRNGKTLGSPLILSLVNRDARIDKAPSVTQVRPGHADFAGCMKYGTRDARDVLERASARETAARVMVGAVCASLLAEFGIQCFGHLIALKEIEAQPIEWGSVQGSAEEWEQINAIRSASSFNSIDPSRETSMREAIDAAKQAGDTLGGLIEIAVLGLPPGLGNNTQWDRKLDAQIAAACMSVQAMKSVEIGLGRDVASRLGSQVHDPMHLLAEGELSTNANAPLPLRRASNNAGGIEGGMTTGEPLIVRVAMKPIATLMQPLPTVDLATWQSADAARERSDTCAAPAASVVLENVVAVPLLAALLEKCGGDSLPELQRNFAGYIEQLRAMGKPHE